MLSIARICRYYFCFVSYFCHKVRAVLWLGFFRVRFIYRNLKNVSLASCFLNGSVSHEIPEKYGVHLYIKREDLIHKEISETNFAEKLQYNFQEAREQGFSKILTFGGAYSNHIAATAFAGKQFGFDTVGVIRGEEPVAWSNTLQTAHNNGMQLHFISREQYKDKANTLFIEDLHERYGSFYLVPEGGANALAVRGCEEIVKGIDIPFDYICCPCGTGTTLAGIINGLQGKAHAIGFSALKATGYFEKAMPPWLDKPFSNWQVSYDYHFGGYAKVPDALRLYTRFLPADGHSARRCLYGQNDVRHHGPGTAGLF